ncbi:MAG: hypothetical protein ACI88A_001648 [Paraglaciecola sp.]
MVHVDKDMALVWSVDEVLRRYHKLHQGTLLTQKYAKGDRLSPGENISFAETVEVYRSRLYDISWFMRNLNEYIARETNKEDGCTGKFWEGRFKSQALLDDSAVLACMAYADLNPIRARMDKTPETARHTSIKKRLQALRNGKPQPDTLFPFIGSYKEDMPKGIAYHLKDYCELVEVTGRCIREGKAGHIDSSQSHILERLGLASDQWLTLTTEFEKHFCYAAGSELMMKEFKTHTKHKRLRGMGTARALLNHAEAFPI